MTQALAKLAGLCVLTNEGEIGFYDAGSRLQIDARLTQAFRDYTRRYLASYLSNPGEPGLRIAVLYRSRERQLWGHDTLSLETPIVKDLYRSGGKSEALTEFQKRNRAKSIYRGIELLLEYRNEAMPDQPVYVPVLFDRGTTLDGYPDLLDGETAAEDASIAVIEVLNLIAAVPMAKRDAPAIALLRERMQQNVIRKDMRRPERLTLVGDLQVGQAQSVADPYAEDPRAERGVTLPTGARRRAGTDEAQHRFAQWMEPQQADAQTLRGFTIFRDADLERLAAIAGECRIYRAPTGAQLLERGTDDQWNLFLLEGKVQLEAADGARQVIEGGTPRAQNPISFLKPRKYTVTALSAVRFLWLHERQL